MTVWTWSSTDVRKIRAYHLKRKQEYEILFLYSMGDGTFPLDDPRFLNPIPLERPHPRLDRFSKITYQDYLSSIRHFILSNWDSFTDAVRQCAPEGAHQITGIEIRPEKHGSDYHPARVTVRCNSTRICFVVNVAMTERGISRINKEFHLLRRIHSSHTKGSVPKVFFLGTELLSDKCKDILATMFLGEWLDDYYEFHLSLDRCSGSLVTLLWDTDNGTYVLSQPQVVEIQKQIVCILSSFYDTETFEEVFPWHHASGDFVVKNGLGGIDVKLITVRQYAPRIAFDSNCQENKIESLFQFFANLTIRTRLDRLDGIGDVAWADERSVECTIEGFLNAMKEKIAIRNCSETILDEFMVRAREKTPFDVAEMFKRVIASYHSEASDFPVIMKHLPEHIFQVYKVFQGLAHVADG